ncbi:hydrophobe/amphiphile efflux-1 (HAE1) family protein [Flavobacterium limnosediminis JC2902]|uniref:Hydrophobe/amphiphile efflux-1 (HAE1) family protein n=1 Tax=Flavobacterium limnosediminis JC2902 TaxID=1341181 RepID=V6STA5_9FLAO|nr:multidrug efflux RND transporter permease subunit [Flavobacterium limnosediminis]ESU29948.1 hydrophobe/amphiphile efflux-1 (HAE1) family protein [Flavobacterium limnosediminis JC2902]
MDNFFVRRPIVAIVLSILIVIIGFLSLRSTPISKYPDIAPPIINVNGSYRGANAINVEQAVATPIEQKVNGVENMIYMQSTNAGDGNMGLSVTFDIGTNLDIATMLTQNRVAEATPKLPQDVRTTGVSTKKSLLVPMLLISLHSPNNTYDAAFLNNYATINVVDALARIKGVGEVLLYGGSNYAMRVWIKPDVLSKYDLTALDVMSAIQEQNAIAPGGKFGGPPAKNGNEFTYNVMLSDRLIMQEDFENIIIKSNIKNQQIRLKDVATVSLGTENYFTQARLNGKPAGVIGIKQMPGSNALEVAENVKKTIAKLSERFPNDLKYDVSLDTTLAVSEGINEIVHTLIEAIFLVILVVFIFLQNWRATLIPLITVPISLIGVFMLFPLLGFSVNVLSLLGLVLAIGIVVDDAIVVVEAVMHHIEHGMTPREATNQAMKEVSGPVIAIAIVLTAVFIPVALTPGITGRLYQQFAITIAISVIFSAISALTLSPALCAMLLKPAKEQKGWLGKFYGGFNRIFDSVTEKYTGIAAYLIKKSIRSLIFIGIVVGVIVILGAKIPSGFVPEEDEGYFYINVELPSASSLERTSQVCKQIEGILAKDKNIEFYTTNAGFSLLKNSNATNNALIFISPVEWSHRDKNVAEIMKELNAKFLTQITDATVFAFGPPPIAGIGNAAGFTMMLQDKGGNNPQYLAENTKNFMTAAKKRPEIGTIRTTFNASVPQIRLEIDRDKVKELNLSLADVNMTVGANLGGQYINEFNRYGRQYIVLIQGNPDEFINPTDISKIFLKSKDGNMVPLSSIATIKRETGPEFTNRFNLYRSAEIGGTPAPGYSSAQALKALEETAKEVLPQGMGYEWSAMSFQEKAAEGKGSVVFIMALVFVFLILAAQYESWKLPFSVLLGTPFAVFGAFLGLYLCKLFSPDYVNNVFAQIGLVLLIGLAAKNAILIVEFAKAEHEKGVSLLDSALTAAKLRFRPILMTAFAFILGVVPLLTASGAGAQARKVMGTAVFSGMLVATILGVCFIPTLFVFIESFGKKKTETTTTENNSEPNSTSHD